MAIDFFEHQEVARRNTGRMVVLFALAVIGLITVTYLVLAAFFAVLSGENLHPQNLWNGKLLLGVGAGMLLVVGGAIKMRMAHLSQGGHVVAELLGGRRVLPTTTDEHERRLMNVVEEMAIASGVPVPPVFVLDREMGINAFAAGHHVDDAVIGITHGALTMFTRDELQGVIAHEFSHILNGDMRLNIRLMGVLYGILVIGLAGRIVLQILGRSGRAGSSRRSKDAGGVIAALIALGACLMVIGWIGTVLGNVIKAAVSRQREFLADASAVQFTRNPTGIGGALKKIAGFELGSRLADPHAAEMSHMLFGAAVRGLYSTHPPLEERIRRIDPSLLEGAVKKPRASAPSPGAPLPPPQAALISQLGEPSTAHLDHAARLLASLPAVVRDAAHEPYSARALVYALLLSPEADVRERQRALLSGSAPAEIVRLTFGLFSEVQRLSRGARLPLVEMALPALASMTQAQFQEFRGCMLGLIGADQRLDVFEWALLRVTLHHLERHLGISKPVGVRHASLDRLAHPVATLLSALAHEGSPDAHAATRAFEAGAKHLTLDGLRLLPRAQTGPAGVDEALQTLAGLAPEPKRRLLTACAHVVSADRQVTPEEAELFRAFADTLDCPVPPLLAGQSLV